MASERRVEYLDVNKLYPLVDFYIANKSAYRVDFYIANKPEYRAKATGEFRAPKKGEWYLSGAVIEAYRAFSDYSVMYPIARIYKVRKVEHWEIIDGS